MSFEALLQQIALTLSDLNAILGLDREKMTTGREFFKLRKG
jgi:hypothetical protein